MEKRKAVVVDDDSDIATYLSSILEEHGFSVRRASNTEDAERIISSDLPHLICLDLLMPGRNGIQFFARLRGNEKTRHIPCVMITGIREQLNIDWKEIVTRLKARVPDGFVEKPVNPARFISTVEKALNKARTDQVPEA